MRLSGPTLGWLGEDVPAADTGNQELQLGDRVAGQWRRDRVENEGVTADSDGDQGESFGRGEFRVEIAGAPKKGGKVGAQRLGELKLAGERAEVAGRTAAEAVKNKQSAEVVDVAGVLAADLVRVVEEVHAALLLAVRSFDKKALVGTGEGHEGLPIEGSVFA